MGSACGLLNWASGVHLPDPHCDAQHEDLETKNFWSSLGFGFTRGVSHAGSVGVLLFEGAPGLVGINIKGRPIMWRVGFLKKDTPKLGPLNWATHWKSDKNGGHSK